MSSLSVIIVRRVVMRFCFVAIVVIGGCQEKENQKSVAPAVKPAAAAAKAAIPQDLPETEMNAAVVDFSEEVAKLRTEKSAADATRYIETCADGTVKATLYSTHIADGLMVPVRCQPAIVEDRLKDQPASLKERYSSSIMMARRIAAVRRAFVYRIPTFVERFPQGGQPLLAAMSQEVATIMRKIQTEFTTVVIPAEVSNWMRQWVNDPLGTISLTRFVPAWTVSSDPITELHNCVLKRVPLFTAAIVRSNGVFLVELTDECLESLLAAARLLASGRAGLEAVQAIRRFSIVAGVNSALQAAREQIKGLPLVDQTSQNVFVATNHIQRMDMGMALVGPELARWMADPHNIYPPTDRSRVN